MTNTSPLNGGAHRHLPRQKRWGFPGLGAGWRRPQVLTMAWISVMLAGCSSVEPLPADPSDGMSNWQTQANTMPALPVQWWLTFEDSGLQQQVESALVRNYSLQAALANWRQSQATLSRTSADQSIQADASLQRSQQYRKDGNTGSWSPALSASYELDFWGQLEGLEQQAQLNSEALRQASRVMANTVAAEVSLAWYGIGYQQQRLGLLRQQQQRLQDSLTITRARFERGLAAVSDVWQQQQLLESLASDRMASEAQLALYQQQLALWSGAPEQMDASRSGNASISSEKTGSTVLPTADSQMTDWQLDLQQLQQRPDVQQAWLELQAADAGLAAAVANQYPRLTLTANVSGSGDSLSAALDNWAVNLAAGLVAPILDGGRRAAEVQQQQAARQAALASYRQTLLQAGQEVQSLLVEGRRIQQQQGSLERQLMLAQQNHDYQQARYRRGVGDFLAMLSANQDVLSLEQRLLESRWLQLANRINLYRAVSHGRFDSQPAAIQQPTSAVSDRSDAS